MLTVAVLVHGFTARPAAPGLPHHHHTASVEATPLACAPSPPILPVLPVELREARGWGDDWAASQLLNECFDGSPFFYYSSLRAPGLNANVFFRPVKAPVVMVAVQSDGKIVGVAQVMQARLTDRTGVGAGRVVAYLQSVAVAPGLRRRGIGLQLVQRCEAQAEEWCAVGEVEEAWLALALQNGAARRLYDSIGYEVAGQQLGNYLMRKQLGGGAMGGGKEERGTDAGAAAAAMQAAASIPSSSAAEADVKAAAAEAIAVVATSMALAELEEQDQAQ